MAKPLLCLFIEGQPRWNPTGLRSWCWAAALKPPNSSKESASRPAEARSRTWVLSKVIRDATRLRPKKKGNERFWGFSIWQVWKMGWSWLVVENWETCRRLPGQILYGCGLTLSTPSGWCIYVHIKSSPNLQSLQIEALTHGLLFHWLVIVISHYMPIMVGLKPQNRQGCSSPLQVNDSHKWGKFAILPINQGQFTPQQYLLPWKYLYVGHI